jgi:heat shock protein HslJ
MKNLVRATFCSVLVLSAISIIHGAPAQEGGTTFKDVEGKEWMLSEFVSAGKTVRMDRQKLELDNFGGVYTIQFQENGSEGRVSGMGAPNRYFGPYTAGANRSLSIGNMASTMMATFREPDGLRENEYFNYLSKVTRWDIRNGKLELYSSAASGAETVLIFGLK